MERGYFPVACWGKLPSFADFVRHNASSREVLSFDEWIRQGLYYAQNRFGREWKEKFLHAPPSAFQFWPANSGRFLVGVLQPSSDRSGRQYPFVLSLLIDPPRLGSHRIAFTPVLFADFFKRARTVVAAALEGIEMSALVERTSALHVEVPYDLDDAVQRHEDHLRETSIGSFIESLFGSDENGKQFLVLQNLLDILGPLKGKSLSRVALGMRFPLPPPQNGESQAVCIWLELITRLARSSADTPYLFWTESPEGRGHLLVFFRQPVARAFGNVVVPSAQDEMLFDLESESMHKAVDAEAGLGHPYRSLLRSESASLHEFLERM